MLEILRNKRNSLFIQILLGAIILSFIIFFGSSSLRDSNNVRNTTLAEVNGEPVSAAKAQLLIQNQLEQLKKNFKEDVPPQFQNVIEQNVINSLISNKLLSQNAKKLGLTTPPEELRKFIKDNPQFQKDGRFNAEYYIDRFLPGYRRLHGSSYEEDVKEDLATQKIIEEMASLYTPTEKQLQNLYQQQNTKYKFSIIKVKTSVTPDEEKEEALPKELQDKKKEQTQLSQEEIANTILQDWKDGKNTKSLEEKYDVQKRETEPLSITQLASVYDGKEDVPALKKLTVLTEDAPFLADPIQLGSYYYLVKLEELQKPEPFAGEEELEALKTAYQNELINSLQTAWIKDLRSKAEIEFTQ